MNYPHTEFPRIKGNSSLRWKGCLGKDGVWSESLNFPCSPSSHTLYTWLFFDGESATDRRFPPQLLIELKPCKAKDFRILFSMYNALVYEGSGHMCEQFRDFAPPRKQLRPRGEKRKFFFFFSFSFLLPHFFFTGCQNWRRKCLVYPYLELKN